MKISQDEIIRRHLLEVGTLTRMEAQGIYQCRSITSNIVRLRASGLNIKTEYKKDLAGQRYARWHCVDSKNCDKRFKESA